MSLGEYMYQRGWSCGVEKFEGKYDFSKGSFYANVLRDRACEMTIKLEKELGIMTECSNVWPSDLSGFENDFKQLG